jgi:hypothetical protein
MHIAVRTVFVISLLACASADAQVPPALIGNWVVHWHDFQPERSELVVTDSGGTWRTQINSIQAYVHQNPCLGRKVPITVEPGPENKVVVNLKFSTALTGCRDAKLHLRVHEDGSISGRRGKYPLTFDRQ